MKATGSPQSRASKASARLSAPPDTATATLLAGSHGPKRAMDAANSAAVSSR